MTDDELRAWCAKELLGWDFRPNSATRYAVAGTPVELYDMWWEKHPDPEMAGTDYEYEPRYLEQDLTGWRGFGRVVEWCHAQEDGYLRAALMWEETGLTSVSYYSHGASVSQFRGESTDPALAAMRAVHAALS